MTPAYDGPATVSGMPSTPGDASIPSDPHAPIPTELSYPVSEHTLANGLRLVISPDHAVPSVAVNIWYDVGSRHEQAGRTGFAHLFEHLMFQGSANVAAGDHFKLLQSAGASLNATTWFDRTNYFEALPKGGFELALWLEADRMASLAVTEENFETQREVVKEEKRQRYDNVPYGDVTEHLVGLTFPTDHPYGHTTIGSMADLDAAQLADVQAFFARHYMPSNAVLSVVGDVTVEEAIDAVERHFGAIPSAAPSPTPPSDELPPLADIPRAEARDDVPAEAVHFSFRLPARGTADFDAVDLAFTVLGHGQTSRLHRRLVRRDEVAESAGASTMALIGGNGFGFAAARARAEHTTEELEAIMVAEIESLVAEGPTDEELQRARATFTRGWLQGLARIDSRADQLSGFATLEGDPGLLNRRIAQVESIDQAAVRDAAARWLDPHHRAVLTYRKETS